MAKFWKSKTLLFKIESVYGTDPTPTANANGILATDVSFSPMEGEDVSRNLERPYLGAQETIPAGLRATLTFSTELVGSGTAGIAPAWGPLLRACGFAEVITADTSVAYNPVSSAFESATFYLNIDGTKFVGKGARGTGEITLNAQNIPVIRWTFTALWVAPADAAQVSPTLDAFQGPSIVAKANTPTFTLNAVSLVLRNYGFNFGCDVQPRMLANKEEILIVDRAERLNVTVEAVALATFNPYALALARTRIAANIVHGTIAGKIVTISAPTAQVARPAGLENQQNIVEWPLQLNPLPNAGNDQVSITLT